VIVKINGALNREFEDAVEIQGLDLSCCSLKKMRQYHYFHLSRKSLLQLQQLAIRWYRVSELKIIASNNNLHYKSTDKIPYKPTDKMTGKKNVKLKNQPRLLVGGGSIFWIRCRI